MDGQWCGAREDEEGLEQEVRNFMTLTRIVLKDSDVGALAFHLEKEWYKNLPISAMDKPKKEFQVLSPGEVDISTKSVC